MQHGLASLRGGVSYAEGPVEGRELEILDLRYLDLNTIQSGRGLQHTQASGVVHRFFHNRGIADGGDLVRRRHSRIVYHNGCSYAKNGGDRGKPFTVNGDRLGPSAP